MNIHSIYAVIFKLWRRKRMEKFEAIMKPNLKETILDVGGYPGTWTVRKQLAKKIDILNVHKTNWSPSDHPCHKIELILGDGCALDLEDNCYDILFSNSVIEHVGDWEKQKKFAKEARRVGKKIWIQTPAWECPIEPHFLAPMVHWLPVFIRRRVLRWFTVWGLMSKPTQCEIDQMIATTQLLTKKQFKSLFPDCTVLVERLFFIFPKSYVAYRTKNL